MLTLLYLFTAFARAGGIPDLDQKPGFRDLNWGTPPTAEMRDETAASGAEPPRGWYSRPNEVVMIGDIPVSWTRYIYWKSELYQVLLYAEEQHYQRLLQAAAVAYGEPTSCLGDQNCVWRGEVVELAISNPLHKRKQVTVSYRYLPIAERMDHDIRNVHEEAVRSRASDL